MNDETTPAPVEDDTTGEQAPPEQAPEETPAPRRRRKSKDVDEGDPTKRYAAYNKSLGRYVGGVRDTKAEADKIAAQITEAGHTAEIREF